METSLYRCPQCKQEKSGDAFFLDDHPLAVCQECFERPKKQIKNRNININNNDRRHTRKTIEMIPGKAWCSGHQEYHLLSAFPRDIRTKTGVAYYCKEYARQYHHDWFQQIGKRRRWERLKRLLNKKVA
jgi:hypothetical protein